MASEQEGQDVENRRRWYIDPKISVADIITILSAAIGIAYAYSTLDKRLSILETLVGQFPSQQAAQDSDRDVMRANMRDMRNEIRQDLQGINNKLDRLVEKRKPE